ncbi:MAG TPA: hypothetical protein VJB06_04000 [archaeon]|nr:hypothetical protein [archaeon]
MAFLLDTNFLLIPGQFGVDIFKELEKFGKLEVYTIDLVIGELERLAAKKGKDSKAAKLGLTLIKEKNVAILQSEEKKTDRELERLSKDYVVCTQDKEIIKKLRQIKGKTISLRQKKYLVLV